MGQFVRFSLTGVLYFPYSNKKSLKLDAAKFKKTLKGCLLSGNGFLPKEVSVTMLKANDVNFVLRTDDEERHSLSYHLSIMAHVDAMTFREVDKVVQSALVKSLTQHKAGLVIFSSVSEEKDTRNAQFRLGSQYHYNERTGLVYTRVNDYNIQGYNR
jgi:hypothetical protein